MATHTYSPVLGKRLRTTELTPAGGVAEDAMSVVSEGFIRVSLTAEVEDGAEIIVRNASGNICVNEKRSNTFKRFNVEVEFCGVNPELLTRMTNAEPYEDADGDVAGFTVPEGPLDKYFALELWTGLSGYVAAAGVTEASGYLLLPFVAGGVLGDIVVEGENAVTFSMTGGATRGGNQWDVGPFDVIADVAGEASTLPTPLDPYDHLLLVDTSIAPPPSSDDPVAVPTP